ncbi:MarR family transcriptional regulator [Ahrensia kielensis]|jgi:DNA-binding MarR family transcriptional regulator|uniref:MarR family transcriptional regulator n=1 Tax=Ahrensia kielensis TaxID=76980 RepID=A0ABU9T652_9HYPH|nr:MarR family transcriptional regulator [Ahrensia sp. 13_GOM-1096m]
MDEVDLIIAQWAKQRPELNTRPMALIGRLMRVSHVLAAEMGKTFAKHNLNGPSFDVLATLLRSGPPHALSPNDLLATMMITSGTMTNRIDRLEQAGLVKRIQNQNDKRSVLIALTEQGKTLIEKTVTAHVETQEKLVSPLTDEEQATFNKLLIKYLSANENV